MAASDPALDDDHADLVCEGLDTVATVTLNGQLVARTANQHRGYRFAIQPLLREGDNELVIEFAPALAAARVDRDRRSARSPTSRSTPST